MGLSHIIPAGVIFIPIFFIVTTIPSISNTILQINEAALDVSDLENSILNTHFQLSNLQATGDGNNISFNVTNIGSTKLWDYDNFDLIITYEGIVGASATNITEKLSYTTANPTADPIAFDSASSTNGLCILSLLCNFLHTVSPGNDRILIVGINKAGSTAISSVEYDGLALTEIRSDGNSANARTSLWYLVNPPVGTADIVITVGSIEIISAGSISLTGVDQTNPINVHNGASGTSNTPTLTLTTTNDETWIVDVVGASDGAMTAGAGQIKRWEDVAGSTRAAGSTEFTSSDGTYAMSWSYTTSTNWAISAVALNPAGIVCCVPIQGWNIEDISNDAIDPDIINNNETAKIRAKTSYQILDNGDVYVTLSTDNGAKVSSFTSAS